MLTQSGIWALLIHGSPELKDIWLPKLVSGEWAGTMNLTEPHAGSDVGALRTRAVREDDRYRISGQKIFITWGEHDMAENIVHMVLARIEGAPEGRAASRCSSSPNIWSTRTARSARATICAAPRWSTSSASMRAPPR